MSARNRTRTRLMVAASLVTALTLIAGAAAAEPPPAVGPDEVVLPPPPEDLPGASISDAWAYEADGSMTFHVSLDAPAEDGDGVNLGIIAMDVDDDLLPFVGTHEFDAGDMGVDFTLSINQDNHPEPPEHFQLLLIGPDGIEIVDGIGDGVIYEGSGPILEVDDPTVVEGGPGDGVTLDFAISATYAPPEDVTFRFNTVVVEEEAELESDFLAVDEVLTLEAGTTAVSGQVPVVGDGIVEKPGELVQAWASDVSIGAIADDTGVGRIEDDDLAVLSVDDVTEVEGTGGLTELVFTVSLDQPAPYDIDVDASAMDGTATAPADWQDDGQTELHFAPGETIQELVISVVGDSDVEPDETFTVVIHDEQASLIGDAEGLGTIVDDDGSDAPGGTDGDDEVLGTATGRDGLPFTGASSLLLGSLGSLLVGLGFLLVLWHRRREAAL